MIERRDILAHQIRVGDRLKLTPSTNDIGLVEKVDTFGDTTALTYRPNYNQPSVQITRPKYSPVTVWRG